MLRYELLKIILSSKLTSLKMIKVEISHLNKIIWYWNKFIMNGDKIFLNINRINNYEYFKIEFWGLTITIKKHTWWRKLLKKYFNSFLCNMIHLRLLWQRLPYVMIKMTISTLFIFHKIFWNFSLFCNSKLKFEFPITKICFNKFKFDFSEMY